MKPEIKATIEYVFLHYSKELFNYTVEGVRGTAHVPPGSQSESGDWTTFLLEYLQENDSPDFGPLRTNLKAHKKKLIELERTFAAIHCYRMVQQENYEAFVAAQTGLADKLSPENFARLCQFMKEGIPDLESQRVVESLIIFSDLGKSPAIKAAAAALGINPALDTDDMMLAILNLSDDEIATVVPQYSSLSVTAQRLLKEAYPLMTICNGHLHFLEGNSRELERIQAALEKMPNLEQRTKMLNLVFAAQFFDGAGSQGQTFMYGSRTCTNDFYRGYMLMHETMQSLTKPEIAAEEAFRTYQSSRANWMGLDASSFSSRADFEVVLRLACTLRLFGKEMDKKAAQELKAAFYALTRDHQIKLTNTLALNWDGSLLTKIGHAPNYVATGMQNICKNAPGTPLSANDIRNVFNYTVVFARLIEKLWLEYSDVLADPLLPLNFGGLAALAQNPENFAHPDEFDLDALLQKEPILPEQAVRRVKAPGQAGSPKGVTQDRFFQAPPVELKGSGAAAGYTGAPGSKT